MLIATFCRYRTRVRLIAILSLPTTVAWTNASMISRLKDLKNENRRLKKMHTEERLKSEWHQLLYIKYINEPEWLANVMLKLLITCRR